MLSLIAAIVFIISFSNAILLQQNLSISIDNHTKLSLSIDKLVNGLAIDVVNVTGSIILLASFCEMKNGCELKTITNERFTNVRITSQDLQTLRINTLCDNADDSILWITVTSNWPSMSNATVIIDSLPIRQIRSIKNQQFHIRKDKSTTIVHTIDNINRGLKIIFDRSECSQLIVYASFCKYHQGIVIKQLSNVKVEEILILPDKLFNLIELTKCSSIDPFYINLRKSIQLFIRLESKTDCDASIMFGSVSEYEISFDPMIIDRFTIDDDNVMIANVSYNSLNEGDERSIQVMIDDIDLGMNISISVDSGSIDLFGSFCTDHRGSLLLANYSNHDSLQLTGNQLDNLMIATKCPVDIDSVSISQLIHLPQLFHATLMALTSNTSVRVEIFAAKFNQSTMIDDNQTLWSDCGSLILIAVIAVLLIVCIPIVITMVVIKYRQRMRKRRRYVTSAKYHQNQSFELSATPHYM